MNDIELKKIVLRRLKMIRQTFEKKKQTIEAKAHETRKKKMADKDDEELKEILAKLDSLKNAKK